MIITFIFGRCRRNKASVTPNKYKRGSKKHLILLETEYLK